MARLYSESRRKFLAALGAVTGSGVALVSTALPTAADPVPPPPSGASPFALPGQPPPVPPKLSQDALAEALMDRYDRWWQLPVAERTDAWLLRLATEVTTPQWAQLQAEAGRTVCTDWELFTQRGDRTIERLSSPGFASPLHTFAPIAPLPEPLPDGLVLFGDPPRPELSLAARGLITDRHVRRGTMVYTVSDHAHTALLDRQFLLWTEGSPRERFGHGVAILVHVFARTTPPGRVGELRPRFRLGAFADLLEVALTTYVIPDPAGLT